MLTEYVKQIFSADNAASYGRWSSFIALMVGLNWASCYFYVHNTIPDLPSGWLAVVLAPYGITSVTDLIKNIKGVVNGNNN